MPKKKGISIGWPWLLLFSFTAHLVTAWFSIGYHSPDEYFQVIELASYKLGITPPGELAWEFDARIRPAMQPLFVYTIGQLIGATDPVWITLLLRLFSSVEAWLVSFMLLVMVMREIKSAFPKSLLLLLFTFLWFQPYLNARFSSENWSSIFFITGLILLMGMKGMNLFPFPKNEFAAAIASTDARRFSHRKVFLFFLSGFMLGMAFNLRYQSALMLAGLGAWLLIRQLRLREWLGLLGGGLLALFCGLLADRWFYGEWELTPFNYFRVNILEGKTAEFSIDPWWSYYTGFIGSALPPFSLFFLFALLLFLLRFPGHIIVWVALPFLLFHLFYAHKEMRFLFPLSPFLPAAVAFAFEKSPGLGWLNSTVDRWGNKKFRTWFILFAAVNVIVMGVTAIKPANETFSFYHFLLKNYAGKKVTLFTYSQNPYELVGIPVVFFRPPPLQVIRISPHSSLPDLYAGEEEVSLLLESGYEPQGADARHSGRLVYQNIPPWLMRFNYNNWLSRTRMWRVYELSPEK
jgi:phosphatidylinositol glycan class B